MTVDDWVAASLATAPPLTPEQITILRAVFRPVLPHTQNAAPAANGGRAQVPATTGRNTPDDPR